jgi:uncharacterized protein (TIGR02246 family)
VRDLNRMRVAVAPLALALFIYPLAAGAQTKAKQAREEAAIRAVESEYMAAFNAHDPNRLVPLHTEDAVLMVSNAPLASGVTAIRSAFADFFSSMGSATLSFAPTRIDLVSPTVATEYGTYTNTFDTPQGKVTDRGNYTTIWHKVNGKWRIAVDAPVSTTPMPMPSVAAAPMPDVHMVANSSLGWSDFTPPGFDPGMKLAVINGDPAKPGEYTLRLMFPAGYRFPVHWHPGAENLTVVSGTFQLGMGNTADLSALKDYGPGDYLYIPPRHAHFGGSAAAGPSVIQLHGVGPFQVIVGAPK